MNEINYYLWKLKYFNATKISKNRIGVNNILNITEQQDNISRLNLIDQLSMN